MFHVFGREKKSRYNSKIMTKWGDYSSPAGMCSEFGASSAESRPVFHENRINTDEVSKNQSVN